MKVPGSFVTFVRRISAAMVQHIQRHEAVKPYACSEYPKRFCTATESREHRPVHSEYKQFSCGLCDRLFKRKRAVKRHFKLNMHGVTGVVL